jgi:F-type H+-transporting ATPase subunit gamma
MANLKDIKRRIGAVTNTRQITKAMKMVAGAKLRRATEHAEAARPYQSSLTRVLARVAASGGSDASHELLDSHESVERIAVVVFGSDKGLCGSFNNGLFRRTERFVSEQKDAGRSVVLHTFGKKARSYFKGRGHDIENSVIELSSATYMDAVTELADTVRAQFVAGDIHEVHLAFNRFKSVMTQVPTFAQLLPLSVETEEDGADAGNYKYEPNSQQILNTLLPLYVQTLLHQAFLETEAGEHASRMTAMDNATRNASDIIDALTLDYNRARQAAITTELTEIVAGAEAI